MHAVRVHDYRAKGSFFRKAGWALQGPGGHTHVSSDKLHELLHAGKAMIEIDKESWHNLVHGQTHNHNPLKEKLVKLEKEHAAVQKEMVNLRKEADEAYHKNKAVVAAKYHRMLFHRVQQLRRIEMDIAKTQVLLK